MLTIGIPCYNQQSVVVRAVKSALAIPIKNLEVIIGDDASQDGTVLMLKQKFGSDSRVRILSNKRNIGRVRNYRKLLNEASHEWYMNLDADDVLINTFYISDFLNSGVCLDKQIFCCVFAKYLNYNKVIKPNYHSFEPDSYKVISGLEFTDGVFYKYQFSHLTTLYRTDIARKNNFYSMDILSTDVESVLRVSLNYNVVVSNRLVGIWNEGALNASTTFSSSAIIKNLDWIRLHSDLLGHFLPSIWGRYSWRIRMKSTLVRPIYKSLMKSQLKLVDIITIIGLFPSFLYRLKFEVSKRL